MGSGIASSSILADELHKPVIKKFDKRKVYSKFKDNIWGVDLADMQSLSRKNKGIKYLLCAIDLYSNYAFVIPLKDKKEISILNAFDKTIKQYNRKPNKIWVDQGGEFYNNIFKKWLSDNDIIMYSTYNDMVWSSIKDKINPGIKIKDYDKFRFNSDVDLPVNTIIEFRSLLINVSCVIEEDNEYYPEIYLDECSYVKASTH